MKTAAIAAQGVDLRELRVNPDWAKLPLFDRVGWKRLPFGAFAESVNERVEPGDAADEIYVGLEHLDPQELHIRRWGKGSDVIGTKLRFRKGDIIFGRRRAYQRKLAVAKFDGICSAHAMVVRAKSDVVLPEFLPFLMMSDRFMNRAVEISVGSLSPTINWTTLKLEEFALPSLDQQRRIASLLWEIDKTIQELFALGNAVIETKATIVDHHFSANTAGSTYMQPLGAVSRVNYGITLGRHRETLLNKASYLRVANVQRDALDLTDVKMLGCTPEEAERHKLLLSDVLIVEGHASVFEIGRAAVWRSSEPRMLHQNHLIRVRCSENLLAEYLNLYVNSSKGRNYFRSRAKSSSGLNTINSSVVKEFPIPLPDVSVQKHLIRQTRVMDEVLRELFDKAYEYIKQYY